MSKKPWLTFIGMGEDGADGLSPASLNAIKTAKKIYGAKRLIDLLENPDDKRIRCGLSPLQMAFLNCCNTVEKPA